MKKSWIYLCFFLSGFSGLVNEIVWSRLFVYTMGTSHLSIAVVVSVFMGGLALGSGIGGPYADRIRNPLRLYGVLVLCAGLLSGAVAPLLWILEPLLGVAYRLHDGEPGHPFFTLVKALVCAGTILLPTTLMGATLPALARHLTRGTGEVGSKLGALYAVNTFGAVAGALAAGFYLIGLWGLGWSAVLGAAVDVAVGAVVLILTRKERSPAAMPVETGGKPHRESLQEERIPWAVKIAVCAFGVSGFANMCLQLGWTRALILSIGNSTYAFSLIVGIFIFGLAAGGWAAGLFSDRLKNPVAAFGWLLVATAVAAGSTIPWLGLSPARFAWKLGQLTRSGGFDYLGLLRAGLGGVALAILPATILMGMAFPLAGRMRAVSGSGLGRAVGVSYAANTAGAILGTAVTGFVLMPLLGSIWKLLYFAVGLSLLSGIVVILAAPGGRRSLRYGVLGAAVAAILALAYPFRPYGVLDSPSDARPYWHPVVFAMGSYINFPTARSYPSTEDFARESIRSWEASYYRDGEVASVAVLRHRTEGNLVLNISGKVEASAGGRFTTDLQTQLLSGHLPVLVHPAPRTALCLGLGGGMSLGAITAHREIESIDLLELCPEVEVAARLHFGDANKGALVNPRVRKLIGDGRNHLTHTNRMYDIIASAPSNFWIAGIGNLFTDRFYEVVKKRLNPGGILCQFVYGYNIRMEDYRIALRTILRSFDHVTIWNNNYGDTLLLCSQEPQTFDRARIARGLEEPAVSADLVPIGVSTPEDLFRYFVHEGAGLRDWVGTGPINRDLHPLLEFRSPLGFFDPDPDIPLALAQAAPAALPGALFRGFSTRELETVALRRANSRSLTRYLRSRKLAQTVEDYAAVVRDGDPWAIDCAARDLSMKLSSASTSRRELFEKARLVHDTAELCKADGLRPLGGRELASCLEDYRRAAGDAPPACWDAHLALAFVELQVNLPGEAMKSLETARARGAPPHKLSHVRGIALGMQGNLEGAEAALREALETTPGGRVADRGETAYNLGFCLEKRGKFDEAVKHYRLAKELNYNPDHALQAIDRCRKAGART